MDNNFSEKLNKILADPESMQKIMSLAQSLGAAESSAPQSAEAQNPPESVGKNAENPAPTELLSVFRALESSPAGKAFFDGAQERIRLLNALKPYLDAQKREKLTRIISAMESVDAIGSLTKLL